nr:AAC(3) family N-acetyltransferase [Novibacillus thermophilus]
MLHHALDAGLSPLARLYDLNGSVLRLGVGHDSNTSFHLAEYRARVRPTVTTGAPVLENGQRILESDMKTLN